MKFRKKKGEMKPPHSGEYFWLTLEGNNGEAIMHSQIYTSKGWVTRLVKRIKKDVPNAEVIDETK